MAFYESIGQYYHIYSPILWITYLVIVVRILFNVRDSNFLGLVALNGLADLTICVLGNFFYNWPRRGVLHELVYKNLQSYSSGLSFFHFWFFHLLYAEFFCVLFMAFNSFCTLVIRKYYPFFWHECLYKYVIMFLVCPGLLFLNVLLSESRFRYVETTQHYYLYTASMIPQYVSRNAGNLVLILLLALSVLLFLFCLISIPFRLVTKIERYQIENLLVGICYTALRAVFVCYEEVLSSYEENNDRVGMYSVGAMFSVVIDLITLVPSIFLIVLSSKVRRLILPCLGHYKQTRYISYVFLAPTRFAASPKEIKISPKTILTFRPSQLLKMIQKTSISLLQQKQEKKAHIPKHKRAMDTQMKDINSKRIFGMKKRTGQQQQLQSSQLKVSPRCSSTVAAQQRS